MKKQALVIVTPGFPENEADTTCLPAFQQFALSLKKLAAEQQIIVVSFQYPFEKKTYQWHGIEVRALGGKNKGHIYRALTWINAWRELKKLSHIYNLSGFISLWITECALVMNWFATRKKINHLTWIIGQDAKAGNVYVRRIQPKAEQLIAMSDFLQDEFQKNYFTRPAHVIENGINAEIFPEYNQGQRLIDIFGAGSLIPLKNYNLFIELVSELKKTMPQVHAVIAGDGEERSTLQAAIDRLGLQKNISLVGLKSHGETLQLMSQSKVFLHTSNYEGNSTVLMEALYSGCQVVSTCPLSHNTTENLYISKDAEALKQKLLALFTSATIGQKRVVFNTMDHSAERILNLLRR